MRDFDSFVASFHKNSFHKTTCHKSSCQACPRLQTSVPRVLAPPGGTGGGGGGGGRVLDRGGEAERFGEGCRGRAGGGGRGPGPPGEAAGPGGGRVEIRALRESVGEGWDNAPGSRHAGEEPRREGGNRGEKREGGTGGREGNAARAVGTRPCSAASRTRSGRARSTAGCSRGYATAAGASVATPREGLRGSAAPPSSRRRRHRC